MSIVLYNEVAEPIVDPGDLPILALFARGEQGAWYDPSDLSTMFQDAGGTIPVTGVGQPVGLILDKSGNGNHASQATVPARPTLEQDERGKLCLHFDGVDDQLVGPVPEKMDPRVYLATAASRLSSATSNGPSVQGTTSSYRCFLYWSTLSRVTARLYAPYVSTGTIGGAGVGEVVIADLMPRNAIGKIELRTGAGETFEDSTMPPEGFPGEVSGVALPQGASSNERLYCFVALWRNPTEHERATVRRFLEEKGGVEA